MDRSTAGRLLEHFRLLGPSLEELGGELLEGVLQALHSFFPALGILLGMLREAGFVASSELLYRGDCGFVHWIENEFSVVEGPGHVTS